MPNLARTSPRHPCVVERDDREPMTVEVREDRSLLHSLAVYGLSPIPVGCRGGGCGVCRVQVLEGEYESLPTSAAHITAEDRLARVTLACRLLPRGELRVRCLPRRRKKT